MCAHSLFSKRLGVLPSASAARVCRLAGAGPRKALQCLSHPHRAPGVFAVAWGGAGRVLPFYVDGDSGNKRVSGTYHGDPLGSSRRGTQREWGGGGRRMRMGTPQSAGLGVLGVLLLWGRVKGDLSWDSWPVQGGRRDWSSLCALSPETYIVPRRAAPSRAGDRSRGAALPASGAGCRVGLSAPSSSSSPAPFQPLFSRYGSPGAAALLFRGDTKPNHCRSCWAQSRRG